MKGWLAADIGGSKLAAAAFDGRRLLHRAQIATRPEAGVADVVERLARLLEAAAAESHLAIQGLGIACPGPLNVKTGIVEQAPLLGWQDVPITRLLSERLRIPALLENDANAAALGEHRFGAGMGCGSLAYITISTGVGCGLVLDGRIWRGKHDSAGELGHIVVEPGGLPCNCGRRGCLEMYASGTAIGQAAKQVAKARGEHPEGMNAKIASDLAEAGDAAYRAIYEQAGNVLGRGIAILQQLLDVDRILIGGSVSASLALLRPAIVGSAQAGSYWADRPEDWLFAASLQPDSGLYGAACLAADTFC